MLVLFVLIGSILLAMALDGPIGLEHFALVVTFFLLLALLRALFPRWFEEWL